MYVVGVGLEKISDGGGWIQFYIYLLLLLLVGRRASSSSRM